MTGHVLSDLVLLAVAVIVVSWLVSALAGWVYLAWLLFPTRTTTRRLAALLGRNRQR